ncbi:hypothetical protein MHI02_05665 [Oceanobacillus sp. FSL K6-0118]|uniref:hypothetical protein n=1 Tax=Oceanobacillus sp. FSL K6-0118 TaxID=2921418 RepID=UPI0030F986A7
MKQRKVILSLQIANDLIQRGFSVVEVKPSTKIRGNAAFVFELTQEFSKALTEISESRRLKHK